MKGRPVGSIIRNRIIGILNKLNTSYGYEIYTIYKRLFGPIHIRSIYYNLKKGIEKEEIVVVDVTKEIGDYSWGNEVEKVYYAVGPYGSAKLSKDDEKKLEKLSPKGIKIDWYKKIVEIIDEFNKDLKEFKEKKDKMYSQSRKVQKSKLEERYKKIVDFIDEKIDDKKMVKELKERIMNPNTP